MVVKKLLPYGVKDYYPQEVRVLKEILKTVEKELTLWGYEEIKLPTLEYKEIFETTLGKKLTDGFLLKDCERGDILALRYDFTPQIVRFVFHCREKTYPLRIFYKGETFKHSDELWEKIGFGFELVGAASVEADAEIIAIIENILSSLGIQNYTFVLNHRKVFDFLRRKYSDKVIKSKNFYPKLEIFFKNYPLLDRDWEVLEIPEGVKSEFFTLRELLKTYNIGGNVIFNPSLEPERDYYSGLFFKVLHRKGILAGGGRYDRLFELFGEQIPATGGGIKINNLLELVGDGYNFPKRVYIIDTNPNKVWGWKIANLLRSNGIIAERDIISRPIENSITHAKEKGFEVIFLIEGKFLRILKNSIEKVFSIERVIKNPQEIFRFL